VGWMSPIINGERERERGKRQTGRERERERERERKQKVREKSRDSVNMLFVYLRAGKSEVGQRCDLFFLLV